MIIHQKNSGSERNRWAGPEEIKQSPTVTEIDLATEPCPGAGLPLISDGRRVWLDNSDTHSIIFGSTGSKKSRLFGMPLVNLFAMASESFIATDVKGELHQRTADLVSERGYRVITLNLRDFFQSHLWNPLTLPYELYHKGKREEAIALLNDLIHALSMPMRKSEREAYWIENGCTLALAQLLFFIETATVQEANLYNFAVFIAGSSSAGQIWNLTQHIAPDSLAHAKYKSILTLKDANTTFGCVASFATTMFSPFTIRKSLGQLMSQSSFDLRAIADQKTALYIIVPDEKTTLHFLVTIFLKQLYETLIGAAQEKSDRKLPIRLNFILDEFCNIPAIPDFAAMISAARSRNMRFYLMVQGMRQMREKYGEDAETIKGNCDNWVFLTSRELDLLREISSLCGESWHRTPAGSMVLQPMISIPELQRLEKGKGEALILHGRKRPFVTELPDIDEYQFPETEPLIEAAETLPLLAPYLAGAVLQDIEAQRRPLPFSLEVYGKDVYYEPPEEIEMPIAPAPPTVQDLIDELLALTILAFEKLQGQSKKEDEK